ncbi:ROK family protein [Nocardioides fonticola]|uniref:ROK family protein n=1 Tax=Nocardioides fonticola TaxID=450363 RepID=A0ABP7XE30_9ACTN
MPVDRLPLDAVALPTLRLPGSEAAGPLTPTGAARLALLVASGRAASKAELVTATGWPRSTVAGHVEALLAAHVLDRAGTVASPGRGRPAERLTLHADAGVVAAVDVGTSRTRIALARLDQRIVAMEEIRLDVARGPEAMIRRLRDVLRDILRRGSRPAHLRGAVVGIPARVDTTTGSAVRPTTLPGWDAYPLTAELTEHLGCPVVVENDVNLRALGESAALPHDQLPLVAVKLAAGVGAGIVDATGRVFHGFDGGAGDIGHVPVRGADDVPCTCGRTSCLESVASLPALVRQVGLAADAPASWDPLFEEYFALLEAGDPTAIAVLGEAADALGEVLIGVCNLLNPRRIVLTGGLTEYSDELLARVRGSVYRGARTLATRNLTIEHAVLRERCGLAGGLVLGIEQALAHVIGRA